jgi:hypothetical protein
MDEIVWQSLLAGAITIVVFLLLLIFIRPSEVIANWHLPFDFLQLSSQDCYKQIEENVRTRKIPEAEFSRKEFFQKNVFSVQREYLRVRNTKYIFDICAAPYGTGFFVSWWQRESKSIFQILLHRAFPITAQKTYYQLDTQAMFRESIHKCVLEMIEQMTKEKGVRGLTEQEQRININPKFSFKIR